jgi:hypothetical protein
MIANFVALMLLSCAYPLCRTSRTFDGRYRICGDRRRVAGRVREDLLDVGVAGEDVVPDRRGEEDVLLKGK